MRPQRSDAPVVSFGDHAAENLQFIRQAMERGATFTAVPGKGGAAMGAVGIVAAVVASRQTTAEAWLLVWLVAAALALTMGVAAMRRKAARLGLTVTGAPARRFAISLAAPLVAGAAITWALWLQAMFTLMPPVWLLLYGTGVLTGGVFSVVAVRLLGVLFMALGMVALVTPPAWGNVWMGVGFGVLQLAFGIHIARRHGG